MVTAFSLVVAQADNHGEMSEPSKRRHNWSRIRRVTAILLILGSAASVAVACTLERARYMGFVAPPGMGMPPYTLSLEDAQALVKFPIPQLPSVPLEECGGGESRITFIDLQANWKHVLLIYSHGLWLRAAKPHAAGPVGW